MCKCSVLMRTRSVGLINWDNWYQLFKQNDTECWYEPHAGTRRESYTVEMSNISRIPWDWTTFLLHQNSEGKNWQIHSHGCCWLGTQLKVVFHKAEVLLYVRRCIVLSDRHHNTYGGPRFLTTSLIPACKRLNHCSQTTLMFLAMVTIR